MDKEKIDWEKFCPIDYKFVELISHQKDADDLNLEVRNFKFIERYQSQRRQSRGSIKPISKLSEINGD